LQQFGQEKSQGGRTFLPLVDEATCKLQEFFVFKIQRSIEWMDKAFWEFIGSIPIGVS